MKGWGKSWGKGRRPQQPAPIPEVTPENNFARTLDGKDSITAVNQFCQRYCSRPITRDDIVYSLTKFGSQYQCTVKLNCIESMEFAGELCSNQKDAKTSAAQQVMSHFMDTMETMSACSRNTASNKKSKKRASSSASVMPDEPDLKLARIDSPTTLAISNVEPAPGGTSWKAELNMVFSKIVRRVTGKGEILYITNQVQGGFQTTVRIPGLPDHWGQEVWAGEVCGKKADAEQSVAKVALDHIKEDRMLMALYAQPPKPNTWLANGGLQRQRERERAKAEGRGSAPTSSAPVAPPSFATGGMDPSVATLAALGYYGNFGGGVSIPGMPIGFS